MLDELHGVAWERLDDATGRAERVPDRLRSLLDPAPGRWVPAIQDLWDWLNQGVVYEATPPAVPFLAWIATRPRAACSHRVLELLGHVAAATVHWTDSRRTPWEMSPAERGAFGGLLAESRAAIVGAARDVLPTLADPRPGVRVAAAYFFGEANAVVATADEEQANDLRTSLLGLLNHDADPLVRGSAALALERIAATWADAWTHLRRALDSGLPEVAQVCVALVLCGGTAPLPRRAVEVLRRAMEDPVGTDYMFDRRDEVMAEWAASTLAAGYEAAGFDASAVDHAHSLPWFSGRPSRQVISRVCGTAPEYVPRFIDSLVRALRTADEFEFRTVAEPVLRYVFRDPRPASPGGLTALQSAALKALCENAPLWASPDCHRELVLESLGLPRKRGDCEQLSGGIQPSPG